MEVNGLGRRVIGEGNIDDDIYRVSAILIRNGIQKYQTPPTNFFGFMIKKLFKEIIIIFVEYGSDNVLKTKHYKSAIKALENNHIRFVAKDSDMTIVLV